MSSSNKNNKKFTIAVEGNIGSGKSTVLSHLAKSSLCDIIPEPIESWTNHKGHNILAMFYDDPHRWAFLFETNALMTLAKLHTQSTKAPVKVLERSIHSTRYCFIENLHRSHVLQDVEYQILDDYFEMLTSNQACQLDLIIYLRATPKTCFERIRARNRPEEISIDLNYLTTLHHRHEEWLISQTHVNRSSSSPPIIIVDADQNKERVYTDTNNHVINLISC